jgi:hypothetical protein
MNVDDDPLPYTVAGKLMLVAAILTLVLGVGGTVCILATYLPARRYPLAMLCVPFVLPAVLVFFGGSAICRRLGIRIRKDDVVNEYGRIEVATHISATVERPTKTGYCRDCVTDVETDDDYRCPRCGWPL